MDIRLARSALVALSLEALMVGAFAVAANTVGDSAKLPPGEIMLTVPPAPQKQVVPPKPTPTPRQQPRPKQQPKPEQPQPPKPEPKDVPAEEQVKPPPRQIVEAKPPAPSTPVVSPKVTDLYKSEVRSAVQGAMQYPYAARMARIQGQTQVSFDLLDRKAGHMRVLVSSGYSVLDQAALKAVNDATYPVPPQELAGKTLTLEVWVKFKGTIN